MITSNFRTRQITTFAFASCFFILTAALYAQNSATDSVKPASALAADKPLSFRFREIEKESNVDKIKNQLSTIISKGQFENSDDKAALVHYYKDYFFGRWVNYGRFYQMESYPETLRKQARSAKKPTDKKKLETAAARWNYPCFIDDFRKDLDRSRSDGEPQKIAVKTAYDFAMEVIASNNVQCTPAVKYNCVLLLGNLYYKTSSSASELPVVYSPAFNMLIKIASSTKTPRYMKIGAIKSLNQIIEETKLSDKQKGEAYNALLEIVKTKVAPADFASSQDDPSGEGAVWTRELAIEGLRLLAEFNAKDDKMQGFYPGKEALGALFQIINDKKVPMTTRIAAMESLGSYNFSKYSELNSIASKLQRSTAVLVIDAIQAELDRKVDNLIWGDDAEQISRQNNSDDARIEQIATTNNAIFLLQRALPAVYALNAALNGVKSDKGWKGLSDFGSSGDKARASEMTGALRDVNSSLNALSKEIMSTGSGSEAIDADNYENSDNLQEVVSVLHSIQDAFRPFTE